MAKLNNEAIKIIKIWRDHGPGTSKIDLKLAFNEIVLPKSNGDRATIIEDEFDSFEGIMARKRGSPEWRIGVSSKIAYAPRKNYTLAHEIGHFIGHRYKQDKFYCTRENIDDNYINTLEIEANEFAATLLMPADLIRKFDDEFLFCHEAVLDLSNMLGVSKEAASYRWVQLSSKAIGFIISRDGFIRNGRASDSLLKKRVFFQSGAEVPPGALTMRLDSFNRTLSGNVDAKVWHPIEPCVESCFAASNGDYIYTYLNF
ncbi:MAG: hypothetical protein RIR97_1346 [Pseudomonadota bacterium]|jgi:hypothetical protein